jgi:integrase
MNFNEAFNYLSPKLSVTKKTLKNYQGAYKRYLAPTLGDKDICEIDSDDLMLAIKSAPPQSAYQAIMVARTIMREAKSRSIISQVKTDPCKTPRIHVKPRKFLTWEQIEKMPPNKYSEQIKFLALHGLRWGEAVVLTESDIYDGLVHINKSIHGSTKTAAGNRVVPYLGHFKQFPKTRKPLAKILNAQGVNIHSLRKSYAYILKSNNVHVTTAQRLLGHASPLVTLKIYTLVLDDEIKNTGKILSEIYI